MRIRGFFVRGNSWLPVSFGKAALYGAVVALCLAVCQAKEPATVSLSGIVYNYSQDALVAVYIGGKDIGSMDEVEPGGVSGGGVKCCFNLPVNAKDVEVEVRLPKGERYKTNAQIEKWWPDLAHYGVVHILPGRKVVMEVGSVHTWPRRDLLDGQLKAIGMKKVINYSGPMNEGPMERTDGVK
jgi:hypothetical protein